MNVKDLLIETIQDEYDYPVIQQGSMSDDEAYPDSFFTFFNNSSEDSSFYDNVESRTIWDFDLNIYSVDPDIVNTALATLKPKLKENGFIVSGKGYDLISDEPSHTGRGINVIYVEFV